MSNGFRIAYSDVTFSKRAGQPIDGAILLSPLLVQDRRVLRVHYLSMYTEEKALSRRPIERCRMS